MGHTCLYCKQWMGSRVAGVVGNKGKLIKYCEKRYKDIESNSRPCRRFKPAETFYCNKLNCRKHLLACLHGHASAIHGKYPAMYSECEKCRQHQITIKPMCEKYGIKPDRQVATIPRRKTPSNPKKPRRGKKKNGMPKGFVLPRRKSKPKKSKPSKLPRRREKKITKLPRRRRRNG